MREIDMQLHLAAFFTRGISLQIWNESGTIARELALFKRLQDKGVRVSFVTYGDRKDLEFRERLPGIDICCNEYGLSRRLYGLLLPWLHRRVLGSCTAFRTFQSIGADAALRAGWLLGKPLIARCGFMWSEFEARAVGADQHGTRRAQSTERKIFSAATRVVVTTPMMADDVKQRVPAAASRIRVIPNYVDTALFSPGQPVPRDFDLVFVGRLAPQKNLEALIEAIRPLKVRLLMIGGPEQSWRERYHDFGDRICWQGRVPHERLPELIRRAKAFILPSHYEGHPKALIEAMACGAAVIGANTPGIRELINDGDNGLLCGTDAAAIRQVVSRLMSDEALQHRLAAAARDYAVRHFSLDAIADMEFNTILEAAAGCRSVRAA